MGSGFNLKLGIFAALSALSCTVAIGSLAYWSSQQALREGSRTQARSAATQLAARSSEEFRSIAEQARFYASHAASPEIQKSIESDGDFLSLRVLEKSDTWRTTQRWSASDRDELDPKHPLDYDRASQGKIELTPAGAPGAPPFLRMAIPFGEHGERNPPKIIVTEIKSRRFQKIFAHREDLFYFMSTASGQLVVASEPGHFAAPGDLSSLGILGAAHDSPRPFGAVDYQETENEETQYAAFSKITAIPGIVVVAQGSSSRVTAALLPLLYGLASAAFIAALLVGLATWWIASRWSWLLLVPKNSSAESDTLGVATSSPQAYAKIADPTTRQALEQGLLQLSGERIEAAVLHAHLHGIDKLSAQADAAVLLKHLNEFHQKALLAVESQGGVVDHMHGGSVVAFWGVPQPHAEDVARAIEAASGISEAAHWLNQNLKKEALPLCRLGMGLHFGPIAVGQVGTAGRLEYSAVGEALEVASRIQQFTEQFGTDFLMTGAAAKRAGADYFTEQVTSGDEETPELYELAEENSDENSVPAGGQDETGEDESREETAADDTLAA